MDELVPKARDRNPFSNLILNGEEEDDENTDIKSLRKKKQKKISHRRRRRSSARFLHLTNHDEDDDENEEDVPESEHLGELYKRAIRMNAENRINAGNSWNLRLIENMDRLIEEPAQYSKETSKTEGQGVNFTKASCTLDASVKIYSYRVDDVHLTSYKVLANLNRNDTKKQKNNIGNADSMDSEMDQHQTSGMEKGNKNRSGDVDTLETNVGTFLIKNITCLPSNFYIFSHDHFLIANINLNKLDAAYDIDPLFHKMSKTFDEGGAKGLLLVNLGVGSNGCNIVFDSTEDDPEECDKGASNKEGMIDISGLASKLESMLGNCSLENLELVPQMRTLRQEYATLEKEGFIEREEKLVSYLISVS